MEIGIQNMEKWENKGEVCKFSFLEGRLALLGDGQKIILRRVALLGVLIFKEEVDTPLYIMVQEGTIQ